MVLSNADTFDHNNSYRSVRKASNLTSLLFNQTFISLDIYLTWYNVGSTEWNFVVLSHVGPNPIEIMVYLCYQRMTFKIFTLRAIFHRDTMVTWLVTAIVAPSRYHGEI